MRLGRRRLRPPGGAVDGKVSVDFVPIEHEVTATLTRARIAGGFHSLDNAVKYTPDGGSVTVRVGEEDGSVALAVSDTGVGISQDQLPLVFERFYRADSASGRGGSRPWTLLSPARSPRPTGGTIEVRSKLGVGSTFVLLLPREKRGPPQEGPPYTRDRRPEVTGRRYPVAGPNLTHHGYQKSLCHILLALVGIGTVINVLAVLAGGSIGTLAGARLPGGHALDRDAGYRIVTLLGVSYFLKVDNALVPLLSVILGLVVGELLDIEARPRRLGQLFFGRRRFSKGESPVSRAFATTSLLFCVGPLTVIGSPLTAF